jgi:hypothetical protein
LLASALDNSESVCQTFRWSTKLKVRVVPRTTDIFTHTDSAPASVTSSKNAYDNCMMIGELNHNTHATALGFESTIDWQGRRAILVTVPSNETCPFVSWSPVHSRLLVNCYHGSCVFGRCAPIVALIGHVLSRCPARFAPFFPFPYRPRPYYPPLNSSLPPSCLILTLLLRPPTSN